LDDISWNRGWTVEPPVLLSEVNSVNLDNQPYLSNDGLALTFSSADRPDGAGGRDFYVATRQSLDGTFDQVSPLDWLNTDLSEVSIGFSSDGLEVCVAVDWDSSVPDANWVLYWGWRPSTAVPFSRQSMLPLANLNIGEAHYDPFFTDDDLSLYYGMEIGGELGSIYVSTRSSRSEPFGPPELVQGINSSNADGSPSLSPDGLLIIFASGRYGGAGESDIWYSTRQSKDDVFSEPQLLPEVNTVYWDQWPYLNPQGLLVFASDRPAASGASHNIYLTKLTFAGS
jgi:hypothetical protein